jgi:GGDEF domain-containing protein
MATFTLVVWSMALGAIAAVALARLGDLVARPSASQLRAVCYHASVFLLVLVLSGVLRQAAHPAAGRLHVLQVLAGPLCVGLSNYWIQGWLSASRRDRLMAAALRVSALALPLLALAALGLPREHQLAAAAAISLGGSALTCWLTFRAWIIGDRLALLMASGCLLTLPAIAGLYGLAMHLVPAHPGFQLALAVCAAASNAITGAVLWRRERHEWHTRETGEVPARDPVTRLHTSEALVRRLVSSQRRRLRTRREGAVVAVTVFDADRIVRQVGAAGLNQVWMKLAARIQREVGVVNPVGRYWDRCFVALVEVIPTPGWLRTLGLRLSGSVRRPVQVTGLDGQPVEVRLDIGIGVVHLAPFHPEIEDVLADAQQLADAARTMASRTAVADAASGDIVPLEQARFPERRGRLRPRRSAGRLPLQRTLS